MPSNIDYRKELNLAQSNAVLSTDGPHLVIAGAGSGKTRVLVYRTAYLVEQGVSPERILLLTFTRRAAKEMLARASLLLDDRCQKVSGGTFHSFANFILRRYGRSVEVSPYFTIMDEADAGSAVNAVRNHLGFDKLDKRFPKKQTLLSIISRSVNKGIDIEALVYAEYPQFYDWMGPIEQIRKGYQDYKKGMSLLDYDDLLVYTHRLLADFPDVARTLSQQYQYIMVDEYQDTNKIQADIVRYLAQEHNNIMVVGDDSQSIYSFRGAHFRNIIDFPNVFPTAKVIILEQNYRSSQPILDLTNEVINSAGEKFDKNLFSEKGGETLPVYVDTANEHTQSQYIVNKILALKSQGVRLSDVAVLFRSGWHSNDLEVELAGQGIPFVKYGGQKFVEAAHIKDVLGYLRVLYNPMNEVSWLRILTLLPGVGERTAAQIIETLVRENSDAEAKEKILQKKPAVRQLLELFGQVDIDVDSPVDILHKVMHFYSPFLEAQYDDHEQRVNDLDSLQRIAGYYASLEEFLADMTLEPPEKTAVDAAKENQKICVTLSTIHSAKGLEWHTVFLIYVAEGYLPSYRAREDEKAIEEERRLFYVATTRAKENLFLLRPQVANAPYGSVDGVSSAYTRVSRFLQEGKILRKLVDIESDQSSYVYGWD